MIKVYRLKAFNRAMLSYNEVIFLAVVSQALAIRSAKIKQLTTKEEREIYWNGNDKRAVSPSTQRKFRKFECRKSGKSLRRCPSLYFVFVSNFCCCTWLTRFTFFFCTLILSIILSDWLLRLFWLPCGTSISWFFFHHCNKRKIKQ